MSLLRTSALLVPVSLALAACAAKPASTIVVGLSSEAPVPTGVDRVRITVLSGKVTKLDQDYDVGPHGTRVPGTLVIEKSEGTDASTPITVIVRGYANGKERVQRRATMGFSEGKQKLLRMPLQFACFDAECGEGATCHAGACVADDKNAEALPDFTEDKVIPSAGTCFPREKCEGASMAMSVAQFNARVATDPTFFDPKDCSIAVTEARPDLNMGLVWEEEPTGNWTIIDYDAEEGWSYVDATHKRVRLSTGLCDELQRPHPRVTKLLAKSGCAPKPPTQPECP